MSKQQETWKESLARVRGELVESKNETRGRDCRRNSD